VQCAPGKRARVLHPSVGRGVFSAASNVAEITTRHGSYEPHAATGSDPEALWLALQASAEPHSTCGELGSQKTTNALSRGGSPEHLSREAQATCEYELVVLL